MGVCRQGEGYISRRIDIKSYRKENYAFALLYFTGDELMNRSMRFHAKKLGYQLTDTGLFRAHRNGQNDCIFRSQSLPCKTEEDIFRALKLKYCPPETRNHRYPET